MQITNGPQTSSRQPTDSRRSKAGRITIPNTKRSGDGAASSLTSKRQLKKGWEAKRFEARPEDAILRLESDGD